MIPLIIIVAIEFMPWEPITLEPRFPPLETIETVGHPEPDEEDAADGD